MIPYLKEVPKKKLQLKMKLPKRIKMILMLNQYWRSAAAVIAYVLMLSLKDILAVSVCQLNVVPSQLVLSL